MQPKAETRERTTGSHRPAEAVRTGGANANAPKRLCRQVATRRKGEQLRALRELRPQTMDWAKN